jgi:hypothetical protein
MCMTAVIIFLCFSLQKNHKCLKICKNIPTKDKKTDDAMKKLKKAVADFVAQATELELSINGPKCAVLVISKKKTKEIIEIENATVKIAENYRYLGITIDRHLHFGLHVKELHTALQRRLNLLKHIAGVKWVVYPKVLNILYKNFNRSKMDYGAAVARLRKRTEDATTEIRQTSKRVLSACWGFLQDNYCICPVGSKHNSNPRTNKNMDDRKIGGKQRIAEHTSRHDNQKSARNT